ncbi:hypothetical protein ACVWXN_006743 [Bradyrhizobium sp. i1.4.4]
MRASTLRRFAGLSRLWILNDSGPHGSSGVAGDGPHRHARAKRLRQLEEENSKLKRIVADLSLDKAMLQDVLSKKL